MAPNAPHPPHAPPRSAVVEDRRRLLSGFLNVDEVRVRHTRHDGGSQTVVRQALERGDSAAIALVDRARRVIHLAEQFRYPTLDKGPGWLLELPAGVVEPGESALQAALREAREETGLAVETAEPVAQCYPSPGGCTERIAIFYAAVDGLQPGATAQDPNEDVALVQLPLDAFLADCSAGRVQDAKTLIAGLWMGAHRARLGL